MCSPVLLPSVLPRPTSLKHKISQFYSHQNHTHAQLSTFITPDFELNLFIVIMCGDAKTLACRIRMPLSRSRSRLQSPELHPPGIWSNHRILLHSCYNNSNTFTSHERRSTQTADMAPGFYPGFPTFFSGQLWSWSGRTGLRCPPSPAPPPVLFIRRCLLWSKGKGTLVKWWYATNINHVFLGISTGIANGSLPVMRESQRRLRTWDLSPPGFYPGFPTFFSGQLWSWSGRTGLRCPPSPAPPPVLFIRRCLLWSTFGVTLGRQTCRSISPNPI